MRPFIDFAFHLKKDTREFINMLIYIFILFIFSLLSVLNWGYKDSCQAKMVFFLSVLILIILSAIRLDVGMDYMSYKSIYGEVSDYGGEHLEPGFVAIVYLLKLLHFPYEFFIFIMSVLTVFYGGEYIRKYSPLVFVSLLIFFSVGQFYFNTFNAIRQGMVIFLFLSNLSLIKERKFWKYLFLISFCALCFHQTAALLYPLYFILHKKYTCKVKLIFFVLIALNAKLFTVLIENSSYAVYLKMENFSADVSLNTYLLFIISLIYAILEYSYKKTAQIDPLFFNLNYLALTTIVLCIQFANTPLIMVFNRFSYYFTPVVIVLIPMSVNLIRNRMNEKIILSLITIVFFLIGVLAICINGVSNHIVPYRTIFS